ncbi:response regulator [Vibrio caribbeanicus]|uniref:response regulator n=1 Tax=Vibrio caribbeanicus TaxID=701175 RepID=UPI0030D6DE14
MSDISDNSKKISVVIAEDDKQIAAIQQRFIARIPGFEVVGVAYNLKDAEELVDILKPDLLMLDVRFPSSTGLDLLRRIRAENAATDVILVTAAKEVETLQEAMRCGVFYYIVKPLIFEHLHDVLSNFIRHREKINNVASLRQDDIDSFLPHRNSSPDEPIVQRLPKGIDAITLKKIESVFNNKTEKLSAEEVGHIIGASRTTARRYLEYMIGNGHLEAEINYGSVGRPERRYKKALV